MASMSAVFRLTARVFTDSKTNTVRDRLIKAATGTFGLRIVSTGLSFLISVLMARLLGVAGYGAYSYTLAWIALLGVPALFGLDRLLIRELAVYRTKSAWGLMIGLVRWANRTALIVSLGLVALAAGVIWVFTARLGFQLSSALWVGLLMLPFVTFVDLRQAAMQGLNHVVVALLPESIVRPLALIVFLGCAYLFLENGLSVEWALALNVAALVIASLTATHLLRSMLTQTARDNSPTYQTGVWIQSALPMMLISGMNVINNRTDTIMLGTMSAAEAVGIYTAASRGANLILLIQTAANVALAPTIAGLYVAGKMQRLQSVITKSARGVLLVSLLIALGLILFGDKFLALFGSEFIQAYPTLAILVAGCVVNTAAGSVGLLLIMTGHERDAVIGIGIDIMLNVALNAALIPKWGVEGAAAATCIGMMARNLFMALVVYQRLGIHSTVLGGIILRRGQ